MIKLVKLIDIFSVLKTKEIFTGIVSCHMKYTALRCARQGLGERTGFTGCLKNLGEPESQGKLSRQWISVNRLTIMKMFFVKLIII